MKFKKVLAFILSLCIVFGMAAIGVSAVDPVSSSSNTVMLHLHSDEALEIYSTYYEICDVYSGNVLRQENFTGDYILTGEVAFIDFYTSCNVTLHNLDISTYADVSFWSPDDITVNLTAKGVNSIVSSNYYVIGGEINVNLTVADNSSLTLNGGSGYINSYSTLAMADGSSLPAVSEDGSLTVSKGTPSSVTHNVTFTALTGGKHKVSCSCGDLDYTVNCSNFAYAYRDPGSCRKNCADCGNSLGTVAHEYDVYDDGDANGHKLKCEYCGDEKTVAHTYNDGYYKRIDGNYCAKECDECYYYDASAATPHSFTAYGTHDSTYCYAYCANCGYYDEDNPILVEHSFTKLVSNGKGWHSYVCERCEASNDSTLEPCFVDDDGIRIPTTRERGPSVIDTCNDCQQKGIYPIYSESIIFDIYDDRNDGWEGNAIVVYVNGVPERVITNKDDDKWETYWMEYDPEASYVFKWLDGDATSECEAKVWFPTGTDGELNCLFEQGDFTDYDNLETIFTYNVADYEAVDAALAKIPDFLEGYTADSVNELVTAVKGVKRMLPESKQSEVDAMASAVENAVDNLTERATPAANGVINLSSGYDVIINNGDKPSYTYTYAGKTFEYSGKYIFLETEDYVTNEISVSKGTVEIEVVNTFIDAYEGALTILNSANVSLKPFGANAFFSDVTAGISVSPNAKLTILEGDGSILAVGGEYCAGIGGDDETDNGEVVIEGSTVFALSQEDGAGIGGGSKGGAGKITIDGGVIHAECLDDDGAGIGGGDDGNGGDIVINGGDIVALAVEDDGAGIGGADEGRVDSITINGGKIIAGSEDGAAIGGGQDSNSCGGKIIINGGDISASIHHDDNENLIGNGNSNSDDENENNFVRINGGKINYENSKGVSPAPRNKDGVVLEAMPIAINEAFIGKDVIITLADGTEIEANSSSGSYLVYAPNGANAHVSVSLAENRDDDDDVFWLVRIFRAIIAWFESLFQRIGDFFSGIFA